MQFNLNQKGKNNNKYGQHKSCSKNDDNEERVVPIEEIIKPKQDWETNKKCLRSMRYKHYVKKSKISDETKLKRL